MTIELATSNKMKPVVASNEQQTLLEEVLLNPVSQSKYSSVKAVNTAGIYSIILRLLLNGNKTLVVVQDNEQKINLVSQFKKVNDLIFDETRLNIMNHQTTIQDELNIEKNPKTYLTHLPTQTKQLIEKMSWTQLHTVLTQLDEINVDDYIKSIQQEKKYPQVFDCLKLLMKMPIEEINPLFSHLIALASTADHYLTLPVALDIVSCISSDLNIKDIKRLNTKEHYLVLDQLMNQSALVKRISRKQIEMTKQTINEIEGQIEDAYQSLNELYHHLVKSNILIDAVRVESLIQFKSGKFVRQLLMQYYEMLLEVNQHKASLLAYQTLDSNVKLLLSTFDMNEEVLVKEMITELLDYYLRKTPSKRLNLFNERLTEEVCVSRILKMNESNNMTTKTTAAYQQLIHDLSERQPSTTITKNHAKTLISLYPLLILTVDQLSAQFPIEDDLVDVVVIEQNTLVLPEDYLKLATIGRELLLAPFKNLKAVVPPPVKK